MLGEFLDKAASLFDRRFLLAWWYPTIVSLFTGLLILSWPQDWDPLSQCFSSLKSGDYSYQLMIILGTVLLSLVLAHFLQVFSLQFVQFWEGYWPKSFWDMHKSECGVEKRWIDHKKKRANAYHTDPDLHASIHDQLFYEYPSQKKRLLPTQLGNVLRAAEDYAETVYGMNTVFWWPRLWLVLPLALQQQIEDSIAPMLAFLNLATQIGIITVIGSIYLSMQNHESWKYWAFPAASITLLVGIAITTLAYRGAVSQAKVYGTLVRSAVDIYRFDLLKSLHQSMPSDLASEKELWANLISWVYLNEQDNAPWYAHDKGKP